MASEPKDRYLQPSRDAMVPQVATHDGADAGARLAIRLLQLSLIHI